MARNRIFQPTTKNTTDLVIGLMKVSLGAIADEKTAADHGALTSVGAVKSASLAMVPTFKEHRAGYPQVLDFKIAELLSAVYKFEAEEVGSAVNLALLDDALDSLETGTPKFRAIEALAEFARGQTLSLFSNNAQLKPNLNLNFGDDFSASPYEFEALANPAYTNQELVYRYRSGNTAIARDRDNQPVTGSPDNLSIGMFQVRVGKPSTRLVGVAETKPAQLRKYGVGSRASLVAVTGTSAGTYTGLIDGAFIVEVTAVGASSLTCKVTKPDGTFTAGVDFSDADTTPVALGDAVTLAFTVADNTAHIVGDIWVVGVYTGSALALGTTNILSPYSFLTSADSVGAIQSASIETNPVYKDHFSGYPKIKDLSMLESSTVTISSALEEINAAIGSPDITKGYATSLYDMIFDASRSGALYNVPVEIVANLATGQVLSFWFPNCQIIPTGEFAPSNEWATVPFQLDAQVQNNMYRIYRQTLVPAV